MKKVMCPINIPQSSIQNPKLEGRGSNPQSKIQNPKSNFQEAYRRNLARLKEDPRTVEELKQAKLIQQAAPLPWRDEELKHVVRALGIEEQQQAMGFQADD